MPIKCRCVVSGTLESNTSLRIHKRSNNNDNKSAISNNNNDDDSTMFYEESSLSSLSTGDVNKKAEKTKTSNNNNETASSLTPLPMETNPELRWSEEEMNKTIRLFQCNKEEKGKISEVRELIRHIDHWKNNPHDVVMFLREHRGDVQKAAKMFTKMVQWRLDNDVDNLLQNYKPPYAFRYNPVAILRGMDKEGHPIHYERTGAADTLSFYQRYGREEYVRHATWVREMDTRGGWNRDYEARYGHRYSQLTVIMDMDGLNSRHIRPQLMTMLQEVLRIIQDYYPNVSKRIIILRAPMVFKMMWGIIKHFMDVNMREAMVITTPYNYQEVLDQYIDREVLPSVVPGGKGKAQPGFNVYWPGGPLPDDIDCISSSDDETTNHTTNSLNF